MVAVYLVAGCCFAPLVLVLWARRCLVMVAVDGESMAPTFHNGDRLLVRRTRLARVRPQDVVVVKSLDQFLEHGVVPDNRARYMVKRAVSVPGDPVPLERVPLLASVTENSVPGEGSCCWGTTHKATTRGILDTAPANSSSVLWYVVL
ncbi:hypothetical protein GCM10027605_30410 [Micromonospora zhanjiangensis]